MEVNEIAALIRDVPNFPKPGILFKDITTLIADAEGFKATIDHLVAEYKDKKIDKILAVEARGFIFGGALAYVLDCGCQIVRKPGKLPYRKKSASYELEYGTDTLEIHEDAIQPGERILLLDDLLATGGTMGAVADLVEELGGEVVGFAFVVELDFLKGRDKLAGRSIFSLIHF